MQAPSSFGWKERQAQWNWLASGRTQFDVVIVGGGITGAAIAREAALSGLKILLVEKNDFASGTSSRSSKLVHGGVRYLEQFEFGLVHESTRERARLWALAPELTSPLAFLFPAFETSRVPLWKLNLGLWLYDLLAAFRTPSLHRKYSTQETLNVEPYLRSQDLSGSIFYWDGATDDALLTLGNIIDAKMSGALTMSRVEFQSVEWNRDLPQSSKAFHKVKIKNTLNGETAEVSTRSVVCALGPWTDQFPGLETFKKSKLLAPTRGSHIVVPKSKLPSQHAVVMTHPTDGRVLFTIPWGEFTVIGTTDIFDSNDPADVVINNDEVQYLLDSAQYYFPKCTLSPSDVISTWSGLRPLIAPSENASASQVSREHHLEFLDPGLLIIAGGKLTTHREMAEQCVNEIVKKTAHWKNPIVSQCKKSPTRSRPFPKMLFPQNSKTTARMGSSEATQLTRDDVAGIIKTQMVLSIEDLLVRRTAIFYKEPNNGLDWVTQVKDIFMCELNWSESDWERELTLYKNYVNKNVRIPLGRKTI